MVEYDEDGLIMKYEFNRDDEDWVEVKNSKTTNNKRQPTSFRLSPETISLLKQLAEDESRSITNMVESLIKEKAKAKEIGKLEAKLKV